MSQKGSVLPIILILLVLAGVAFGFNYIFKGAKSEPLLQIPKPAPTTKVYKDTELNFQFEYPSGFDVLDDNEETYFKATATDHRKNFSGYVGYKPPKLVKGLMVMKKGLKEGPQYDNEGVILWVFDNPNKLSIDSWFDKYWYYPFVWGIFAYPGKGHIQPNVEATISGQPAKSVVVGYQPGKPEFTYVANGDKMFLFRAIKGADEKAVNQVLGSFKFTN